MKRNLKWKNEHIPYDVTAELITWIAKSEYHMAMVWDTKLLQKYKRKVTGWGFFLKTKILTQGDT